MRLCRVSLQEILRVFLACYPITEKEKIRTQSQFLIKVSVCEEREIAFLRTYLEKEVLSIQRIFKKLPKKIILNYFTLSQLGTYIESGEIGAEMLLALGVATRMISFSHPQNKFHITKNFLSIV